MLPVFSKLVLDPYLTWNLATHFYITVPKGLGFSKEIRMQAPEEKGKYIVRGYMISNPWVILDYNEVFIDTDSSKSVTLIVE